MSPYQKLIGDIADGERLLWSEAPNPVRMFVGKRGILGILFTLALAGAFCWMALSTPRYSGWFLLLCAIFVGSLSYECVAGFWTLYGITNRRLIVVQPSLFSSAVESYYPPDIDFVRKVRGANGCGHIVFSAVREQRGKRTTTVEIGFFGIRDVNSVEAMVLDLRECKRPNQSPEPTPGSVTPRAEVPRSE